MSTDARRSSTGHKSTRPSCRSATSSASTPRSARCDRLGHPPALHRSHAHQPADVPQHRRRRGAGHDDPRHRHRADARVLPGRSAIDAVGVSVIGDVEDICNARITFDNGCVANMTASRLALKTERRMRVFSADAYVSLDYQKRYGMVAGGRPTSAPIRETREPDPRRRDGRSLAAELRRAGERRRACRSTTSSRLRAELESFVEAAHGRCPPVVTGMTVWPPSSWRRRSSRRSHCRRLGKRADRTTKNPSGISIAVTSWLVRLNPPDQFQSSPKTLTRNAYSSAASSICLAMGFPPPWPALGFGS